MTPWEELHWGGMPEFVQEDQRPYQSVNVILRTPADLAAFAELTGKEPDYRTPTPFMWYPEQPESGTRGAAWVGGDRPTAPIYVVSKGRADRQLTSRSLSEMGVDHYVVVEAQERKAYTRHAAARAKIIVLDPKYQREYETLDDLGDTKSKGPGPARNFAWDLATLAGAKWHWVMDDNIQRFYRLNRNAKIQMRTGAGLRAMEVFCARYENVLMGGPQYESFCPRRIDWPAFVLNTRIYSCNLIRNDAPFYWRGRYNEDTDLSLRMLKAGFCTVQFNAFLQNKVATQTLGGGNTKEFYAKEGTRPKSEMLVRTHPDVAHLMQRYGRWHHFVDYNSFKRNAPRLYPAVQIAPGADEFGMSLDLGTA